MAEEKASKNSRESWANYNVKTIDRLVCIFKGTLLYCFPSKSATALTNSTSNMGTYGRYCCIYSTIKKPCRIPLQPRFQWKARGLFLESSKNFSGPKSLLSNCNPLVLKSCKENQEDCEVYWLRTSALWRYNTNCGTQNRGKIKSCNILFKVKRQNHTYFARKSYPY